MMRSRKQRNNTPGTTTDRAVVGTHASSSYEIRDDIELNDRGSAYGSYNGRRRETPISTLSLQAKVSAVLKRHALFLISIAGAVHLLFMWRSNVSIGHAQQDSHQNSLPVVAAPHRYVLLSDRINLPHDLPPIYWINLDTSTDRREAMMDMLSSQGIVDAHRVSGVTTDEARHLLQTGHLVIHPDLYSWHETEHLARVAACTLSHLNAIKSAYEAHHEFAFIFEDDAILSKLFQDEWRGYADLAPPGWKILQFATNNLSVAKQGALALTDPFTTWHVHSWCTRAYLINRAGMKTLLDKVHSSVAGQDFWHIEEEMIAADEVIYAVTGDTYTSTGLWIDDFNMKTTVQIDDQDPDVMNSYLPSVVGHPESQIEMKTTGNVFEESLLVLTSVTVGDEEDITKSIEWIIQDSTVCKFHHKCEWNIGFVAANSELMNMIREVYAKLNLPSNIHFHVSINPRPFNKFIFIQNFVEQIMDFDLVLFKDVDMRIIGFPWRTFVERKKDTNAVIIGPLREISLTSRRSREYEPHWFGLHEALRWLDLGWSTTLFGEVMPIEVPYLEQYFVLMDAKFANFFFNIALRPSLVHHSSYWGVDLAWCAAAKSWDSSRPGCHLIPVVTFQDDDEHTMQRSLEPDDEGFEAIATYNTDPMLGPWIIASSRWRDIIGGKNLDEIQHECRVLFGLDTDDSFDLQACATRASGGGMLQTGQGEFLHEKLAVLVTGAGSSEVHGCYLLKGRNGKAWEFEFDNSITGRTFEMFKVDEESGWWNIMERVTDNSGSNPPHYGVEGDSDAVLPPVDGWGSIEYSGSWLGKDPMPTIEVINEKTCVSRAESERECLSKCNGLLLTSGRSNLTYFEEVWSACKCAQCQWSYAAIDTLLDHGNLCANDSSHLKDFQVEDGWANYRLSDAFSNELHNTLQEWKSYYMDEAPIGSLIRQYYQASQEGQEMRFENYDVLFDVVSKRASTMSSDDFSPTNSVVIHVRLGDVVDWAVDSVRDMFFSQRYFHQPFGEEDGHCGRPRDKENSIPLVEDWNAYVKPLSYYSEMLDIVSKYSSVVLMGSAYGLDPNNRCWNNTTLTASKSCQYMHGLKTFFERLLPRNISVSLRLGNTPDDDVVFASHAACFIPSGGGYSRIIGNLHSMRGGCSHSYL